MWDVCGGCSKSDGVVCGRDIGMTDWNQTVKGLECQAKEFGLGSAGNESLQNFSLCVSRAT